MIKTRLEYLKIDKTLGKYKNSKIEINTKIFLSVK